MKTLVSQCNSAANGCVFPSFLTTIEPYSIETYTVSAQNLRVYILDIFFLMKVNRQQKWQWTHLHLTRDDKRQMLVGVFLVQRDGIHILL